MMLWCVCVCLFVCLFVCLYDSVMCVCRMWGRCVMVLV